MAQKRSRNQSKGQHVVLRVSKRRLGRNAQPKAEEDNDDGAQPTGRAAADTDTGAADTEAAAGAGAGAAFRVSAFASVPSKNHVYFSCFDDPDALVEVPLRLLHSYADCLLAKQVQYDRPTLTVGGAGPARQVWRAGMRRAVLLTIVNSLQVGHLVSCDGTGIEEVLSQLAYQGICVSARGPSRGSNGGFSLGAPSCGVAFRTKGRPRSDVLDGVCGQLADAVSCWPRLEQHLWDALDGKPQADAIPFGLACSSSRAWIRLFHFPLPCSSRSGRTQAQVPSCYTAILEAIGTLHAAMLGRAWQPVPASVDNSAFLALKDAVRSEALGALFPTRFDREHDMDVHACKGSSSLPFLGSDRHALAFVPACCPTAAGASGAASSSASASTASLRTLQSRSERFSQWVCNTTMASAAVVSGQQLTDAQRYANEVFKLAVGLHCQIPDLARLFGSACADAAGSSPERSALDAAFGKRGMRVVQWYEGPPRAGLGASVGLSLPVGWSPGRESGSSTVLEFLLEVSSPR